jgi:hypothetical protein
VYREEEIVNSILGRRYIEMFGIDATGCEFPLGDELKRRDFLQGGALALLGLALPRCLEAKPHSTDNRDKSCIFICLTGGPSQLDTFDMKPDAPREIRGPYKPIRTSCPDIQISEIFPLTARHAEKFSIIRSMHHKAAAVHGIGHQMVQTGRLFLTGPEQPHVGCVYSFLKGENKKLAPHFLLPKPVGNTGGNMSHAQSAGFLGHAYDPLTLPVDPRMGDLAGEPEGLRDRYGRNQFGQTCLLARRFIERGVRFVTINMFETVFNQITWDIHGSAPFSSINDYRDAIGPMFDKGYSSLLEDLSQRGLLESTLVVATGEFGRTPKINSAGGRDHWPQAWSALLAGGGIQGGRIIGKTDEIGAYPTERPTSPAELVATIYHLLGVDLETTLPVHGSHSIPVVDPGVRPVMELL